MSDAVDERRNDRARAPRSVTVTIASSSSASPSRKPPLPQPRPALEAPGQATEIRLGEALPDARRLRCTGERLVTARLARDGAASPGAEVALLGAGIALPLRAAARRARTSRSPRPNLPSALSRYPSQNPTRAASSGLSSSRSRWCCRSRMRAAAARPDRSGPPPTSSIPRSSGPSGDSSSTAVEETGTHRPTRAGRRPRGLAPAVRVSVLRCRSSAPRGSSPLQSRTSQVKPTRSSTNPARPPSPPGTRHRAPHLPPRAR